MALVTLYRGREPKSLSAKARAAMASAPRELREAMRAHDDRAEEREAEYALHETTFTDHEARTGDTPRLRKPKIQEKAGVWEGPRLSFTLLIGLSKIWAGPASIRRGKICLLCRYLRDMPERGVCVGCGRSGQDHHPELRSARPKPRDNRKYAGAGKLRGGVA